MIGGEREKERGGGVWTLFPIWFENGNGGAVPRQQKKTGGVLTGHPAAANPVRYVWGRGGGGAGGRG